MKYLILANFDVGLYQFRKELIQELLKENEVLISLPYGDLVEPLKEMGCKFINTPLERRGMNFIKDLKLIKRYIDILKREKPDKVITYTIKPNTYGGMVCQMMKIPYAVNITGLGTAFQKKGLLRTLVMILYKTGLRKASPVFFENVENKQTLIDAKIIKDNQAVLLNGAGVNLEHYRYIAYPEDCDETRFLFVGRVMREKGINELFKAVQALRNEGINCSLDVLGGYEEDYKRIIDKYEKEGWLRYHGFQNDVRPFIAKCHCFVLPSWHEGMANTNLECAASGRPVITSNIHGCKEAIIEGESGLLCEPHNTQSLYRCLKKMAMLSYSEREKMGCRGRQHMKENFSKDKIVEKTVYALKNDSIF